MKQIDIKTWVIIILSIALVIVGYIAFKPAPIDNAQIFIEKRVNDLELQNDSLRKVTASELTKSASFQSKIDSLQSLKPQIQIKYVTKYKEIDKANASAISSEFADVFTNNGVK